MDLPDLIDLEAQLLRDRGAEPRALEDRDGGSLAGTSLARPALLRRWLEARREAEPGQLWPGRTIAGVLRGIRAALAIAGIVLGWGAAAALLRYTGQEPVNAWDFLLAFVFLQLALFALLLSSFFLPVAALGTPLVGLFRGLVAAIYPRLAARLAGGESGARLAEWRALWHRLRSRRSLYHQVEPWILLSLTQAFGVAFNVGALVGCLRLIVFSDIAFSWSTTLVHHDAARFHGLVHALAAPFAWLWPDADPSRLLVEATRYSRLEGAYVLSGGGRAAHPDLVGGWWPFLLSAVAFYGLLPRLAALAFAQVRARRLLARLPLDDSEVSRAVRRISEPRVETRSEVAEAAVPASSAPRARPALREGTRCTVMLWRDVPTRPDLEAAVARQTRWSVAGVKPVGGRDHEEGALDWAQLPASSDSVVVVAEGWEAPDKALLGLLRELRRSLGPRRPVVVLLAQVDPGGIRPSPSAEVRIWEEGVGRLEDPYVAVEPLRGAP